MFARENNSIPTAPVACMSFGNTGSFPVMDQGTTLESLQPYDLSNQPQNHVRHTDIPMTGTYVPGLQDSFLNQTPNPAVTSDPFAFDYRWNEDTVALSSIDMGSSSINTPSTQQPAIEDSDNRTVLTLFNVESGTLNSMLETAFNSKTKVKMETYH